MQEKKNDYLYGENKNKDDKKENTEVKEVEAEIVECKGWLFVFNCEENTLKNKHKVFSLKRSKTYISYVTCEVFLKRFKFLQNKLKIFSATPERAIASLKRKNLNN